MESFGGRSVSTDLPDVPSGQAPATPERRLEAVLWDMDGTLCDTEPYWMETEHALAERFGGEWTHEDAMQLVGNDLLTSGEYIRNRWNLDLTPRGVVDLLHEGVVERVLSGATIPWRPGAIDLLAALNDAGVPCALVTMSWDVFALPIVERLPRGRFDVIVTGDNVDFGKPHPEPYLKAARLLGVDPASCVAIEDSNTGATSAEEAGCTVVTVENHVPLAPGARRVPRASLVGVTPEELRTLLVR